MSASSTLLSCSHLNVDGLITLEARTLLIFFHWSPHGTTAVVKKPPLEYSVAIVMGLDANTASCFFKNSLLISGEVTGITWTLPNWIHAISVFISFIKPCIQRKVGLLLSKWGRFRTRGHGAGPGGSSIALLLVLVLNLNLVRMKKMDVMKVSKRKLRWDNRSSMVAALAGERKRTEENRVELLLSPILLNLLCSNTKLALLIRHLHFFYSKADHACPFLDGCTVETHYTYFLFSDLIIS